MDESATTATAIAGPKTIVIERRWAIIGGAVIAALVLGLGVALAFTAGDDGPDGPPGLRFSTEGGFGYGGAPGGQPPLPEGAPIPDGVPQAPGTYPPSGGVYPAPRARTRLPSRRAARAPAGDRTTRSTKGVGRRR